MSRWQPYGEATLIPWPRVGKRCRLLAQRYRYRHIEFMVGIGGIADMNGRVASANSVEFDPQRTFHPIYRLLPQIFLRLYGFA
jgi:hypothetical protein